MMADFQPRGYGKPEPNEPYEPKSIAANKVSGSVRSLVLLVNIEGRDRKISLSIDALEEYGLSGPAAVEELREIRKALEGLRAPIGPLSKAVATLADAISRQKDQ